MVSVYCTSAYSSALRVRPRPEKQPLMRPPPRLCHSRHPLRLAGDERITQLGALRAPCIQDTFAPCLSACQLQPSTARTLSARTHPSHQPRTQVHRGLHRSRTCSGQHRRPATICIFRRSNLAAGRDHAQIFANASSKYRRRASPSCGASYVQRYVGAEQPRESHGLL